MAFVVCPICKSPWWRMEALCDFCRSRLLKLREPVVRDEGRLKICSLFAWRNPGPLAFPWWVRALKHQEREILWREIAIWLLNAFGPLEETVFVPIPSEGPNHARGLAQALAVGSGYKVEEAISLGLEAREQKRLSRGERADIQFERENWRRYENVVIVDDVVTTGATARAAFHTLGRPRTTRVWCLLDRRPCGV